MAVDKLLRQRQIVVGKELLRLQDKGLLNNLSSYTNSVVANTAIAVGWSVQKQH